MRKLFLILVAAVISGMATGCVGTYTLDEQTVVTTPDGKQSSVEKKVMESGYRPGFQPFFYGGYYSYPTYGGYGYGLGFYNPNCGVAGPDWVRFQAAWGYPPRY